MHDVFSDVQCKQELLAHSKETEEEPKGLMGLTPVNRMVNGSPPMRSNRPSCRHEAWC